MKGHSGFYSCERCEIKGESIYSRLVMAAINCSSRTDQLFNQYDYHPLHQFSRWTLPDYGILCISEFSALLRIVCGNTGNLMHSTLWDFKASGSASFLWKFPL